MKTALPHLLLKSLAAAIGLVISTPPAAAATNPVGTNSWSAPGPLKVTTLLCDWTDPTRQRLLPIKLYIPTNGSGPFPVVLFSHGLGGTREGAGYLGQFWASHGYVSIHLQHPGSDEIVWRGKAAPMQAMQTAAASLTNALNRPLDVRFVLDALPSLNRTNDSLKGRLDLDRIGISGHSFGAYTVLACLGQRSLAAAPLLGDPRLKAGIAMSSPVPAGASDATYSAIRAPVYHLTGTRDDSPIGRTVVADRRVPFDHSRNSNQLLLTLQDGDHMVFSGRTAVGRNRDRDQRHHELILTSTTAFWDAWLKENEQAKQWLYGGGFEAVLKNDGKLEQHAPGMKAQPK